MKKTRFFLVIAGIMVFTALQAQVINLNNTLKTTVKDVVPDEFLKEAKAVRSFSINPALQSAKSVKTGDRIALDLFENQNYTAAVNKITTDVNGNFTVSLKLPDFPMAFGYVTTDKEGKSLFFVSIPELKQKFTSRSNVNSQASFLVELDESFKKGLINDEKIIPEAVCLDEDENPAGKLRNAQATCSHDAGLKGTDPATIDLLIVYTPAAAAWAATNGGGINNVISGAMAQTNAVLSNQGNGDAINLVHSELIDYTEATGSSGMNTDLNRLTGTSDEYMDNVHQLRKQYNADIVALFEVNDYYGGLGWVLNNSTTGSYDYAFNVIRVQQASWTTTSLHEIGHNMGMLHNVEDNTISPPLFPYAYGWHWLGSNSTRYGSVMSYIGAEAPYFSNPDATYYDAPTGTATANNAQVFRNIKHIIAYYSDRVQNLPDVPANIVVSNPTANGATFSWDASANATSYLVCKPAGGGGYSYYTTTNTTYTVNYNPWFPQACTDYDFFIAAVNECGDVVYGPTVTFKTACTTDPVVTTLAATNITYNSATLNKTVTERGATVNAQGFKYKAATSSTWLTSTDGNISGLTENTQYKFYAFATTSSGTINGSVLTFTTSVKPLIQTWTPLASSTNWYDRNNWTPNGIPDATTKVYIPKSSSYPILNTPTSVAEVHFSPGAQIGGQHHLAGKAFVSYDLSKRDSWLMLSIPLGEVYPADFSFGGYPTTNMQYFASKATGGITTGKWEYIQKKDAPISQGNGFMLKVDNNDPTENPKGLKKLSDKNFHELPAFEHFDVSGAEYAFYNEVNLAHDFTKNVTPTQIGVSTFYFFYFDEIMGIFKRSGISTGGDEYNVIRTEDAYKLAGANVSKPLNFEGGSFALIGNPYMAALDFGELYEDNKELISDKYYIWVDDQYQIYSYKTKISTSDLDEYIAPLQGFIVLNAQKPSPPSNIEFKESMTTVRNVDLRSAASNENRLDIVARSPETQVRTVIAKRAGGGVGFNEMDARKITNGITDVPEIYTLKPNQGKPVAVAINIINDDDVLIPLGLATSYAGNLTLSFSGMDNYDSKLSLIDVVDNKEINLTGLASFDYGFNYTPGRENGEITASEDRFFIRISKIVTGIEETIAEKVNVYESDGLIRVLSGSSNSIKEVAVYNTQGALMYKANSVNSVSHTVNLNYPAGVYIVKVISEKNTDIVKLVIR